MIRIVGSLATIALLAACGGDGRGSQYSSARAQTSAIVYTPITPGANPVGSPSQPRLTGAVAITPGAQPVSAATTQPGVVTTAALPAATVPVVKFATGPIYSACLSAGRQGATQERCGCVQWVADRHLDPAQQRRGADYFQNQHDLQEVRQSDNESNSDFWTAWSNFGSTAGATCRGT